VRHAFSAAQAKCARCRAELCAACVAYAGLQLVCPVCAARGRRVEVGIRRAFGAVLVSCFVAAAVVASAMCIRRWRDPLDFGDRSLRAGLDHLERHPCDVDVLTRLAHQNGGYTHVLGPYVDRALTSCTLPVETYEVAYRVHENLRDPMACASDATRALAVTPTSTHWFIMRALAWEEAGKSAAAARDLLAVLHLDPTNGSAVEMAADLYRRAGHDDVAERLMVPVPDAWSYLRAAWNVELGVAPQGECNGGGSFEATHIWTGYEPPVLD
jgi:hypothetical protein